MTHAWVLSAIRMLNVILFVVDAFANLVSRATELFARVSYSLRQRKLNLKLCK